MVYRVISLVVFCLFFIFLPHKVFADEDFDISTNSTYTVSENGTTQVTQVISIKNKTEYVYTPSYSITAGSKDIRNLRTFNSDGTIPSILKEAPNGERSIELTFPRRVIGLGKINAFTISYDTSEIAIKKGSIWEINIPGLSSPETFTEYNISLAVPDSFGAPSIVKPQTVIGGKPYRFTKSQIGTSGIYILFGESQYYKLNLSYHIQNPKLIPVKTEVALPPITSYQDVRIERLDPAPSNVYQDEDGNWLAVYTLNPHETKTIKADILVRVYSKPIFEIGETNTPLSSSKYWEVDDPKIRQVAKDLKTPREIYNFVVNKLSYNYEKVSDKNTRLGAAGVLSRPDFAVCLEFTDLFVTLARASGVKARAVEGYAYTQNSRLRPLSLVQDVLHSWPEYFDEETKTWIMVDPTWGNTTRGTDYFSSFDFDHIAFVIKGKSSTYPIPAGGYKAKGDTKDVNVSIVSPSSFSDKYANAISVELPSRSLSGLPISGSVLIKNTGNTVIKNNHLLVESDLSPNSSDFVIDTVLPFGTRVIPIAFSKTQFLTNKKYKVKIHYAGSQVTKTVDVGLFPDYFLLVIGGVVIVGSTIVAWAAYKTWGIYISKLRK